MTKIIGYKGFDKDFKCLGKQYEVGKEFIHEGEIKLCESGIHFCENPLDVLNYYDLTNGQFALIEADGVSKEKSDDSKRVAKSIKIKSKLELPLFIKASIDFLWKECSPKTVKDKNTLKQASSGYYAQLASSGNSAQLASSGDSSQLASSGNYAKLASSGDSAQLASSGYSAKLASSGYYAQLASSGNYAQLASSGEDSIVAGIGIENIVKGTLGNWLVLAEWRYDEKKERRVPVNVQTKKVDGKKIKADTFYQLKKGKFVEYDNKS